jgi:hypothetical protein
MFAVLAMFIYSVHNSGSMNPFAKYCPFVDFSKSQSLDSLTIPFSFVRHGTQNTRLDVPKEVESEDDTYVHKG